MKICQINSRQVPCKKVAFIPRFSRHFWSFQQSLLGTFHLEHKMCLWWLVTQDTTCYASLITIDGALEQQTIHQSLPIKPTCFQDSVTHLFGLFDWLRLEIALLRTQCRDHISYKLCQGPEQSIGRFVKFSWLRCHKKFWPGFQNTFNVVELQSLAWFNQAEVVSILLEAREREA